MRITHCACLCHLNGTEKSAESPFLKIKDGGEMESERGLAETDRQDGQTDRQTEGKWMRLWAWLVGVECL